MSGFQLLDILKEEAYEEIASIVGESNENPTFAELSELKYLERCIKEVLRLYPIASPIMRISGEEIKTSGGLTIPKGANIVIHIYDLHRNTNVWEDPDKFDPDRFLPEKIAKRHPYSYIPFSAGSRNCIGVWYIALLHSLEKYSVWNLRPDGLPTPTSCLARSFLSNFISC